MLEHFGVGCGVNMHDIVPLFISINRIFVC